MSALPHVLIADPPWKPRDNMPGPKRGAAAHYPVMPTEAIKAFDLPPLHRDCYLLLWRLAAMPQDALDVCRAWGFVPKSEIVWVKTGPSGKPRIGMGQHVRLAHETCIIAVRKGGRSQVLRKDFGVPSVFFAPRGEHSAKPDEFYRTVDRLLVGPKVELFARRQWPGWTCLGDEMPEAAE